MDGSKRAQVLENQLKVPADRIFDGQASEEP